MPSLQIRRKPLHPTLWLKVPRAVAVTTLVLRKGAELDSEAIGNLLPGSEIFVLETKPPAADGSVRALVAETPMSGVEPLGWVTAIKDGSELLEYVNLSSAMPMIDGAAGFFTSVGRLAAAPLPEGSPRSEGSQRSARSLISSRGGAGGRRR